MMTRMAHLSGTLAIMQDYSKLRVWADAHELAIDVRKLTESFPRTGYAELKSQMTTAAESVVLTIVEGTGASTQKEFARFLDMSIKSSRELESQLLLAQGYGIVSSPRGQSLTDKVVLLRKQIYTLRKKVLENP